MNVNRENQSVQNNNNNNNIETNPKKKGQIISKPQDINKDKVGANYLLEKGITNMQQVHFLKETLDPSINISSTYDARMGDTVDKSYVQKAHLNPYVQDDWSKQLYESQGTLEVLDNMMAQFGQSFLSGIAETMGSTVDMIKNPAMAFGGDGIVEENAFSRWGREKREKSQYNNPIFANPDADPIYNWRSVANILGQSGNIASMAGITILETKLLGLLTVYGGGAATAGLAVANAAHKGRKIYKLLTNVVRTAKSANLGRRALNLGYGAFNGIRENYMNTHRNALEQYNRYLELRDQGELDMTDEEIEKVVAESMHERFMSDLGPSLALSLFQTGIVSRSLNRGKTIGSLNNLIKRNDGFSMSVSDGVSHLIKPMFNKIKNKPLRVGTETVVESVTEGIEEVFQDGVSNLVNWNTDQKLGIKSEHYSWEEAVFTDDLMNSFLGGIIGSVGMSGVHQSMGAYGDKKRRKKLTKAFDEDLQKQTQNLNILKQKQKENDEQIDSVERELESLEEERKKAGEEGTSDDKKPFSINRYLKKKKELTLKLEGLIQKRDELTIEGETIREHSNIASIAKAIYFDYHQGNEEAEIAVDTLLSTYKSNLDIIERYLNPKNDKEKQNAREEISGLFDLESSTDEEFEQQVQELKSTLTKTLEQSETYVNDVRTKLMEYGDLDEAFIYANHKYGISQFEAQMNAIDEEFSQFVKDNYGTEDALEIETIKNSLYTYVLEQIIEQESKKTNPDEEFIKDLKKTIDESNAKTKRLVQQEETNEEEISEFTSEKVVEKLQELKHSELNRFNQIFPAKYRSEFKYNQTKEILDNYDDFEYRNKRSIKTLSNQIESLNDELNTLLNSKEKYDSVEYKEKYDNYKSRLEDLQERLIQLANRKITTKWNSNILYDETTYSSLLDNIQARIDNAKYNLQKVFKAYDTNTTPFFSKTILTIFNNIKKENIKDINSSAKTFVLQFKRGFNKYEGKFKVVRKDELLAEYNEESKELLESYGINIFDDSVNDDRLFLLPIDLDKKDLKTKKQIVSKAYSINRNSNAYDTSSFFKNKEVASLQNDYIKKEVSLNQTIRLGDSNYVFTTNIHTRKYNNDYPIEQELLQKIYEKYGDHYYAFALEIFKRVQNSEELQKILRSVRTKQQTEDGEIESTNDTQKAKTSVKKVLLMNLSVDANIEFEVNKNEQTIEITNIIFDEKNRDKIDNFLKNQETLETLQDTLEQKSQTVIEKESSDDRSKGGTYDYTPEAKRKRSQNIKNGIGLRFETDKDLTGFVLSKFKNIKPEQIVSADSDTNIIKIKINDNDETLIQEFILKNVESLRKEKYVYGVNKLKKIGIDINSINDDTEIYLIPYNSKKTKYQNKNSFLKDFNNSQINTIKDLNVHYIKNEDIDTSEILSESDEKQINTHTEVEETITEVEESITENTDVIDDTNTEVTEKTDIVIEENSQPESFVLDPSYVRNDVDDDITEDLLLEEETFGSKVSDDEELDYEDFEDEVFDDDFIDLFTQYRVNDETNEQINQEEIYKQRVQRSIIEILRRPANGFSNYDNAQAIVQDFIILLQLYQNMQGFNFDVLNHNFDFLVEQYLNVRSNFVNVQNGTVNKNSFDEIKEQILNLANQESLQDLHAVLLSRQEETISSSEQSQSTSVTQDTTERNEIVDTVSEEEQGMEDADKDTGILIQTFQPQQGYDKYAGENTRISTSELTADYRTFDTTSKINSDGTVTTVRNESGPVERKGLILSSNIIDENSKNIIVKVPDNYETTIITIYRVNPEDSTKIDRISGPFQSLIDQGYIKEEEKHLYIPLVAFERTANQTEATPLFTIKNHTHYTPGIVGNMTDEAIQQAKDNINDFRKSVADRGNVSKIDIVSKKGGFLIPDDQTIEQAFGENVDVELYVGTKSRASLQPVSLTTGSAISITNSKSIYDSSYNQIIPGLLYILIDSPTKGKKLPIALNKTKLNDNIVNTVVRFVKLINSLPEGFLNTMSDVEKNEFFGNFDMTESELVNLFYRNNKPLSNASIVANFLSKYVYIYNKYDKYGNQKAYKNKWIVRRDKDSIEIVARYENGDSIIPLVGDNININDVETVLKYIDLNFNKDNADSYYYKVNDKGRFVTSGQETIKDLVLQNYTLSKRIININENIENSKPKYIAIVHPRIVYKLSDDVLTKDIKEQIERVKIKLPVAIKPTSTIYFADDVLQRAKQTTENIELKVENKSKKISSKKPAKPKPISIEQKNELKEQNDSTILNKANVEEVLSKVDKLFSDSGYDDLLGLNEEPVNLDSDSSEDSIYQFRLSDEQLKQITDHNLIPGISNTITEEITQDIGNKLIHLYLKNPNQSSQELREAIVKEYNELLDKEVTKLNGLIEKITELLGGETTITEENRQLFVKINALNSAKEKVEIIRTSINEQAVKEIDENGVETERKVFNIIDESIDRFTNQLNLTEYAEEVTESESDVEIENQDEQQDKIYSKEFYETNGKLTLSGQLKYALQGMKKPNEKGLFGIDKYYSLDETYDLIQTILIEEISITTNIDSMINALRKYSNYIPQINDIIDMLEASKNSDGKLANQFVMHFNKQFMNFLAIGTNNTQEGLTDYKVIDANVNTVLRKTYNQWKNNFKTSEFLIYNGDGTIKANVPLIQKVFGSLNNELNGTDIERKVLVLKRFFDLFGITLHEKTVRHLITKGYTEFGESTDELNADYNDLFVNDKNGIGVHILTYLRNILNKRTLTEKDVDSVFNNAQNAIKNLIILNSKYDLSNRVSVVRLGGKNIYLHANHNSTSVELNRIKTDKAYRDQLSNNFFSKHATLLKVFNSASKKDLGNFGLHYMSLEALIQLDSSIRTSKPKKFNDLDKSSQERVRLAFFQNMRNFKSEMTEIELSRDVRLKTRVYQQEFPTLSDKDAIMMMDMLGIVIEYADVFDTDGNLILLRDSIINSSSLVPTNLYQYLFDQLIMPELERILARISVEQIGSDIKGYEFNSQFFNVFPFLNTIKKGNTEQTWLQYIHSNYSGKLTSKESVSEFIKEDLVEFMNDIAKELENFYETQINEQIKVWEENGIVEVNEEGKIIFSGFNKEYYDTLAKNKELNEQQILRLAAIDYIINNDIGRANLAMVFTGDMALFGKSKGQFDFTQSISQEQFDDFSESAYDNYVKRMAAELAPGQQLPIDGEIITKEYTELVVKDPVMISNNIVDLAKIFYPELKGSEQLQILKEAYEEYRKNPDSLNTYDNIKTAVKEYFPEISNYLDIEVTDGQEFSTLNEHLSILYAEGKITKDEYQEYKEKINNQREAEKNNKEIDPKDLLTNGQLQKLLQPIKPVITGNVDAGGINSKVYIKTSSFPLIPQVTATNPVLNDIRIAMEQLEELNEKSDNKKSVRLVFSSGIKVGSLKQQVDLFDNNGQLLKKYQGKKGKQALVDLFVQHSMSLPRDNFKIQMEVPVKDKGKISLVSQAFRTMFGDGVCDIDTFKLNGKTVTGQQLYEEYTKAYNTFLNDLHKKLKKELTLEGANPNSTREQKIEFLYKIKELILEEAKKRNYPTQDIEALELFDFIDKEGNLIPDFSQPLWSLGSAYKVESLLLSVITNRFIKTKMPGNSYVLGSSLIAGRTISDIEATMKVAGSSTSRIIFTDKWDGELHGIRNENGKIKRNQVFLPPKFNYTNEDGENVQLNLYNEDGSINTNFINDKTGRLNTATSADIMMATSLLHKQKVSENEDAITHIDKKEIQKLRDKGEKENNIKRWIKIANAISGGKQYISQEMLEQISMRIPFSSHLSASVIEVVGILPPEVGDLAILPENLMVQKGFDFDVDKEYTYVRTFRTDEFGNAIANVDRYRDKNIKSNKQDRIFNRLFNIYDAVLTNPDERIQRKINQALSMDKIKRSSNAIYNLKKERENSTNDNTRYVNLYDAKRNIFTRRKGSVGRVAIGAYSNAITLTGLMHTKPEGTFYLQERDSEGLVNRDDLYLFGFRIGELGRRQCITNPDRSIIDVFMERQNAATDNVKVDALGKGGITKETLNVDILINLLGLNLIDVKINNQIIPIEFSQLLFSQLSVSKYIGLKEKGITNIRVVVDELINHERNLIREKIANTELEKTKTTDKEKIAEYDNNIELYNQRLKNLDELSKGFDDDNIKGALRSFIPNNLNSFAKSKETLGEKLMVGIGNNFNEVEEFNLEEQLGMLGTYLWFETKANEMSKLQQTVSLFSNGLGKSFNEARELEIDTMSIFEGTHISRKTKTLNKEDLYIAVGNAYKLFYDYRNVTDKDGNSKLIKENTFMGNILEHSLIVARQIGSQFFLSYNNKINEMVDQINSMSRQTNLFSRKSRAERKSLILKEYQRYLNSYVKNGLYGQIREGNYDHSTMIYRERGRIFIGSVKNPPLARYLRDQMRRSDKTGEYLRKNPLLSEFSFEVNPGKPSFIRFGMSHNNKISEASYYDALAQLMKDNILLNDKDGLEYTTRDLAYDLISYAYLEGGIQEATQFVKYVPNTYLQAVNYNEYLQNVFNHLKLNREEVNYHLDQFKIQFFQHHPELLPILTVNEFTTRQVKGKTYKNQKGVISTFTLHSKNDQQSDGTFNMLRYRGRIYLATKVEKIETGRPEPEYHITYIQIDKLGIFGMNEYQADMNKERSQSFNYNFGNFVQEGEKFGFGSSLVENQKTGFTKQVEEKIRQSSRNVAYEIFVKQIGIQLSKSYNGTEINDVFDSIIDSVLNDLTRIKSKIDKLSNEAKRKSKNILSNLQLLEHYESLDSDYKIKFVTKEDTNENESLQELFKRNASGVTVTKNKSETIVYINLDAVAGLKNLSNAIINQDKYDEHLLTVYNDFLITVVHEITHALTTSTLAQYIKIENGNFVVNAEKKIDKNSLIGDEKNIPETVQNLIKAYNASRDYFNEQQQNKKVKNLFNKYYGFTSIDEFVAETLANEEFRESLRNIKYEDGKTTILQRIVQSLLNFLNIKTGTMEYTAFINSFNLVNLNNKDSNYNSEIIQERINTEQDINNVMNVSDSNNLIANELLFGQESYIDEDYQSRWKNVFNIDEFKCV